MTIQNFASFEADTTRTSATSKLVKAWEAKNAKRAVKASGATLMALSLSACGGSDDVAVVTPVTPVTPVGNTVALTTSQDLVTGAALTANDDTITATNETFTGSDVIVDASSTDNDTLTIATDTAISATPTVAGIENVVINNSSFGAALSHSVENVSGATITINNVQLGGATDATLTSVGSVTVVAGTGVTGTLTVNMVEDAATVVNAGGAKNVVVDAVGATAAELAAQTITVITSGTVDLTATDANTLALSGTGAVTLNGSSADLAGKTGTITGETGQTLVVGTASDVSGTTISGFKSVSVDTTGAASNAFDASKISSPVIVTKAAASAADTITVASGANITLAANVTAEFDIDDGSSTTTTKTGVVNVTLSEKSTTGSQIKIEETGDLISTLNITAAADQTAGDLTITAETATAVTLDGAGDVDLVTSGFTSKASTLDASGLTGDLKATVDAQLLSITAGSGKDAITALDAVKFVLDGGAGDDTLTLAADMSQGTFTNFEILTGTGDFLSTQLDGYTAVVADGSVVTIGAGDVEGNTIDLSGLTFADSADDGVDMQASGNVATQDTAKVLADSAMTITGSNGKDALLGFGGDDTISGGKGVDTITGAGGADTITGGEGNDIFVFGDGQSTEAKMDVVTDFEAGATKFDTISGNGAVSKDEATAVDVKAATSDTTDAITATVKDGIITLGGADKANIDTLAEYIDVAEILLARNIVDDSDTEAGTIGFEFGGNTYLVAGDDGDAEATYATESVIMLEGVTGIVALSTTEALDTIHLA